MTYADQIRNFEAFPFSKYAGVSSREKLVVFAMQYLDDQNIPLTFNNICVATFRLFPEKFYFSEEFKEYPHIEMLNRTILHLRPVERNFATGSVKSNYSLTDIGKEVAMQVKSDVENADENAAVVNKKIMDAHKKTSENDLRKVKESQLFKDWETSGSIDDMAAWGFFEVTPFTQTERINKQIKELSVYAKSKNEIAVVNFLNTLSAIII